MNYSFEYIDIILLAMIAGFIFLRLRGILGKRTGFEGKAPGQFKEVLKNINIEQPKKVNVKFDDALKERAKRGHVAEITFIGVNKAEIKEHKRIGNVLNVTVDFIAEVITCIRDKEKKIVSGDPEKIKKIYDTWVFSRDTTSQNPNWQLVNILT